MKWLFCFSLTLLFFISEAQNPDDHDEIVCKEAEAHAHFINQAPESNPLTANYDLKYYRFEWEIDPSKYYIKGNATPYFETLENDFTEIVFDFSSELDIDNVSYHGQNLNYTQTGDYTLTITLPSGLSAGTLDSLTITYEGAPPNSGFGSFVQTTHGSIPVLWTLSDPFGSQDWWPCKNGLGDKIDSIDVLIRTNAAYRGASNGTLISETSDGDDMIYHWRHRYPITPYLVAIAVTNYVEYTDTVLLGNGKELMMLNYVYPESLNDAKTGTANLVQVLQFFDSLFVTYPFDAEKYGHAQFGWGGGMEHQTMSFVVNYGWTLLAHELAHQWFGDMVTCGSFEDIWLNEGAATFLEGLTQERFLGEANWNNWKTSRLNNIISQSGGSVKVTDTTSVSRIFSGRLSYNKGAFLFHMLRWKLGDEHLFQAMRNYLIDLEYDYAKTPQMIAHLEAVYGQDLTEFFADWYEGQGYPRYTVRWEQQGDNALIELEQTTSHTSVSFFEMPVPVLLKGESRDTLLRLEHTFSGQIFTVPVSFEITSVEFDPDIWLISGNNVVEEGLSTSTRNIIASEFIIYPNPATNLLQISLPAQSTFHPDSWQVLDFTGRVALWGSFTGTKSLIEVKELPVGVYTILLTENHSGVGQASLFYKY